MRFPFRKIMENKSSSKARSLNDVFLNHKKRALDLQRRYLVIRIDTVFFKDFFFDNHRSISVIAFFLIIALVGSFSPFARANVAKFYPTTCLGAWEHPENVEGEPSLPSGAPAGDFNSGNSAEMQSSSGSLYCGGFKGEIPNNTKPTHFRVSLALSVDDGSVLHQEIKPFEDIPSNNTKLEPESTDVPAPSDQIENSEPSPVSAPDVTPPPSENSQSFLYELIAPSKAFAEESVDITTDAILTDELVPLPTLEAAEFIVPPPETLSDQFLEIDYTLDGVTWSSLGDISRASWQNNSFDIPLTEWTNLDNLQISIKTLPTFDDPSVVYLDNMAISVDYDEIEKLVERPTVILKDGADIISSDKNDFSSSEQPTFTITNPNLDTNDIKALIDQNKAEIISDPNGALSDPSVPNESEIEPKYILKPAVDSIDSVNKIIPPPSEDFPISFLFKTKEAYAADFFLGKHDISASVLNVAGEVTDISAVLETTVVDGVEKQQVKVQKPKRKFRPGLYRLKISMATSNATIVSEQDFTWGVLAVNLDKSVYQVGDDAYIQMGVLNDQGHTLCNADLGLLISSPNGDQNNFSTSDGSIIRTKDCAPDNVILVPDYYAHFQIPVDIGTYKITLTANTTNGKKTITDSFDVAEEPPFILKRVGPTRIYPVATYPMAFHVVAKEDWQGKIVEKVPADFEILEPDTTVAYQSVETIGDTKIISWNVSLLAGEEQVLGYNFKAPEISPEFYILGKAQFLDGEDDKNKSISFEESRNWQIASDAACTGSTTGNWSVGANWTGCTGAGGIPAAGDTITINSGVVITVDTGNPTVASLAIANPTVANGLTINTGQTLTISGALSYTANTSTAITQTITLNGTGNINAATITVNAPTNTGISRVTCAAAATGTLSASGAVTLNGAATTTGTVTFTINTCTLSVGGLLTMAGGSTGGNISIITTSGGVLTNSAGLTCTGTAARNVLTIGTGSTWNFTGTMGTGCTPGVNAGATNKFTNTTQLNGAYTLGIVQVNSGTTTLGVGTITFAGTLLVANGATLSLGNFAYTQTGAVTVGSGTSGTISVAGAGSTGSYTFSSTITVNAGGIFNLSTGTHAIVFAGTTGHAHSGTTFNTGTGAITFSGTGAFPISGTSAMTYGGTMTVLAGRTLTNSNTNTVTFGALTMASPGTANSLTLNNGTATVVTGALTFTANATANAETVTLGSASGGAANLTVGSISMPAPTSTGASKIACFASATETGTLTVSGSGTIAITGNSTSTGIPSIDMSAGGCNVITGTVAGTVATLTSGTTSAALLKMGTGTLTMNGNLAFAGATAGNSQFNMSASGGTLVLNGATLPVVGTTGAYTFTSITNLTSTGASAINYATAVANWGALNVNSGTLTLGAAETFTVITIANTATLAPGANLLTDTGNLTCGSAGSATLNGSGGVTLSAVSAVIAGGTCSVTNSGTFLVSGNTAPTISSGAAYAFSGILSVSTALANSGTVTVSTGLAGAGNFTNAASGILNIGFATAPSITTLTALNTTPDNLVNYTAAAPNCKVTTYDDLTFSGSGTVTCATLASVQGDLLLGGTVSFTTGANLIVSATTTIGDGTTLALGAFTFESGGKMTVGGGGTGIFTGTNGTGITLKGDLELKVGSTWTKMTSGTAVFKHGSGGQTLTDSTASKQDLGSIQVSASGANSYRSHSIAAAATGANITATEPTGCALDDIEIAWLYIESDTAITPPSGWSNTFNGTTMLSEANDVTNPFRMYGYWIRRGASAPALTWTFASAWRQIAVSCYSGAVNSGDPFSFGATAVRDDLTSRTYPDTSGTTSVANELLIWGGFSWASPATSGTPPTGFTERQDSATPNELELADKVQAVAGATGTVTGGQYVGGNTGTTAALFSGLKPLSTNTTLTLGSNIKATNITIDASQILDVTVTPFNITLNGNWTNNGGTAGFNARSGTVTLATSATSAISGTTTFNNFSVSGIGAAKTLNFVHQVSTNPVFTFAGTVTLAGASGQLLTINSDLSGSQWLAHFNSTQSFAWVSVKDSGCDAGTASVTTDVNSILGTNNGSCWPASAPSITFSNSDSSIGFGTLSSSQVTYANGAGTGSSSDVVAHTFTITTNAANGYTFSFLGPTLTSGANTILVGTNLGTGGTAGTSQFAISGTLTGSNSGVMQTNYNHTTPKWTYVAGTTTNLATSTGPVTSDAIDMHYEANISPTTPSGAYTTTITYILTGNF